MTERRMTCRRFDWKSYSQPRQQGLADGWCDFERLGTLFEVKVP